MTDKKKSAAGNNLDIMCFQCKLVPIDTLGVNFNSEKSAITRDFTADRVSFQHSKSLVADKPYKCLKWSGLLKEERVFDFVLETYWHAIDGLTSHLGVEGGGN